MSVRSWHHYTHLRLCIGGVDKLPRYVMLVLMHLAKRLRRRRSYPSAIERGQAADAFRVDAHAEGSTIGIGGWMPTAGADGKIDTERSPWLALNLTDEEAPLAFSKRPPYRTIFCSRSHGLTHRSLRVREPIQPLQRKRRQCGRRQTCSLRPH